jgi:hypothetical protein
MAEEPLLDLDTLIVRNTVKIDGEHFPIFSPDELSVMQSHQFDVWGRRIDQLRISEDPEDGAELGALVDQAARAAFVDVPAAVFEKLHGNQKIAIVNVFTGLLLRRALGVAGAMTAAAGIGRTGETSSPGSSASTAASRAGGFMRRLRDWFGRSSR